MKFIYEYTFYFQIVYLYEHVYVDYSIKPFNIVLIYMLNMIIIVLTKLIYMLININPLFYQESVAMIQMSEYSHSLKTLT